MEIQWNKLVMRETEVFKYEAMQEIDALKYQSMMDVEVG